MLRSTVAHRQGNVNDEVKSNDRTLLSAFCLLRIVIVSTLLFLDVPCIGRRQKGIFSVDSDIAGVGGITGFTYRTVVSRSGSANSPLDIRKAADFRSRLGVLSGLLKCRSTSARLTLLLVILNVICVICKRKQNRWISASSSTNLTKSGIRWKFVLITVHVLLYSIYCEYIILEQIERFVFCMACNALIAVFYIWQYANAISSCRCTTKPSLYPAETTTGKLNDRRSSVSGVTRSPSKLKPIRRRVDSTESRSIVDELASIIGSFSITESSIGASPLKHQPRPKGKTSPPRGSTQSLVRLPDVCRQYTSTPLGSRDRSKSVQASGCPNCQRYWLLCRRQGFLLLFVLIICLLSVFFNGVFVSYLYVSFK